VNREIRVCEKIVTTDCSLLMNGAHVSERESVRKMNQDLSNAERNGNGLTTFRDVRAIPWQTVIPRLCSSVTLNPREVQ